MSASAHSSGIGNASAAPITAPQWVRSVRAVRQIDSVYTGGQVCVTEDGERMVMCRTNEVVILRVDTGEELNRFEADGEVFTCFALRPKHQELYAATVSMLLYVWDISGEQPLLVKKWKPHSLPTLELSFEESEGALLLTASADATVKVWDVARGYLTHFLRGHSSVVTAATFLCVEDRVCVVSASDDNVIKVWDLKEEGRCIATLPEEHMGTITTLHVHSASRRLFTAGRDQVVNVFDAATLQLLKTIPCYEEVEDVLVVPASKIGQESSCTSSDGLTSFAVLVAGQKGVLRAFDPSTGKKICDLETEYPRPGKPLTLQHISSLPADQGAVVVCDDQTILLYRWTESVSPFRERLLIGHNDQITGIRFLPFCASEHSGVSSTSDWALPEKVVVSTNSDEVRVYNIREGDCELVGGAEDIVMNVTLSPCGRFLVTVSKDCYSRVYYQHTNPSALCGSSFQLVGTCRGHTASVGSAAIAKNLKYVVTVSEDRTLKMWNTRVLAKTKKLSAILQENTVVEFPCISTHMAHTKDINCVAISPNDKMVATAGHDKFLKLWQVVEESQVLGPQDGESSKAKAGRKKGKVSAEPAQLQPHITCSGHRRGVWFTEFSPVERCVLSTSGDKTVRIWSVEDGTCLKTFQGHTHGVLYGRFINSGLQVISASADGLLKIWAIKTSECLATVEAHDDKIWSLDTTQDAQGNVFFATGGSDGQVMIWKDVTADEEEQGLLEREQFLEKEQELDNCIRSGGRKSLVRAIHLALELQQPGKLKDAMVRVAQAGRDTLLQVSATLSETQVHDMMVYARDWNTNARWSMLANLIVFGILNTRSTAQLLQISGLDKLVDPFLAYNERHSQRVDRLRQKSYLVDYTMDTMSLIVPLQSASETIRAAQEHIHGPAIHEPIPESQPLWKSVFRKRRLPVEVTEEDVDMGAEEGEGVPLINFFKRHHTQQEEEGEEEEEDHQPDIHSKAYRAAFHRKSRASQ